MATLTLNPDEPLKNDHLKSIYNKRINDKSERENISDKEIADLIARM